MKSTLTFPLCFFGLSLGVVNLCTMHRDMKLKVSAKGVVHVDATEFTTVSNDVQGLVFWIIGYLTSITLNYSTYKSLLYKMILN